jgi:hypothetical protein
MNLRTVESLSLALHHGRESLRQAHIAKDKEKINTLRAGNSGILTAEGEFAGCCPHVAHLRQLGIESEVPTADKLIMFQMGIESENAVFQDLEANLSADQKLLREDETGIEWFTSNGTRVTGRPDGVVYKAKSGSDAVPAELEPYYGIELKTVASFWTTREVLFEQEPKLTALIQATHYAWKLGIPYKLSYKNYVNQTFPSWATKFVPKQGQPGSEHISYNDKGEPKNVNPFEIVYECDIDEHGFMWYRLESDRNSWVKSIVNTKDIERFYEFVSRIQETKKLGDKLTTIGCTGKKKSYSHCDLYCPIHKHFSEFENDYDKWISEIRRNSALLLGAGE